ncbi:MAG: transglycosylase SLT domain-containing protein [Bacteriovoracaceae bacterium]|nr:transglycosylase SLT domain-containing protein [Bacteriovoracaceae bacterium]
MDLSSTLRYWLAELSQNKVRLAWVLAASFLIVYRLNSASDTYQIRSSTVLDEFEIKYSDNKYNYELFEYNPGSNLHRLDAEELSAKLLNSFPSRTQKHVSKYLDSILFLSRKHDVNPIWVLSVMWVESHFHPQAVSPVGARGMMQIMPSTHRFLVNEVKRQNLELSANNNLKFFRQNFGVKNQKELNEFKPIFLNMEFGIFYLKLLKNEFENVRIATVAYNMGPGWARMRLREGLPIAVKNRYLNKVSAAFNTLVQSLQLQVAASYVD